MAGVNPRAWRNWYHGVGSTYGTWLIGDPRGFRTFRHKLHVEGDYRCPPPPGVWAPLFAYSKARLKYSPMTLTPEARRVVCDAMIADLLKQRVEVVALAVAANHFHILARYPPLKDDEHRRSRRSLLADGRDPAPRHRLGLARKHAALVLSNRNLKRRGPLWAEHPKFDPIRDRTHQVNVARYILAHATLGADTWRPT